MGKGRQGGGLLVWAIAAIVLLSAASLAIVGSFEAARPTMLANAAAQVRTHAELIRGRIIQCVTAYPSGDNGTGLHLSYPAGLVDTAVSDLECPGSTADDPNLWTGEGATFLPPLLTGYSAWTYRNDNEGVRIWTTAGGSDYAVALSRVIRHYAVNEADLTGDVFTLWITR